MPNSQKFFSQIALIAQITFICVNLSYLRANLFFRLPLKICENQLNPYHLRSILPSAKVFIFLHPSKTGVLAPNTFIFTWRISFILYLDSALLL